MTGQQKPVNKSFNIAGYDGNKDLADILNTFYLRFDLNSRKYAVSAPHKDKSDV